MLWTRHMSGIWRYHLFLHKVVIVNTQGGTIHLQFLAHKKATKPFLHCTPHRFILLFLMHPFLHPRLMLPLQHHILIVLQVQLTPGRDWFTHRFLHTRPQLHVTIMCLLCIVLYQATILLLQITVTCHKFMVQQRQHIALHLLHTAPQHLHISQQHHHIAQHQHSTILHLSSIL